MTRVDAGTPTTVPGRSRRGKLELPEVLLFGDSHIHAIQRAIEKRHGKGQSAAITAYRLLKEKNGRHIGDISFEHFLNLIGKLETKDVVLSMIGGNQHAVFSTIQHPQPFDFLEPGRPRFLGSTVEIIPYRAVEAAFATGVRKGDGKSLEAIRAATDARIVHIIPPPPKADNAFVEQNHESLFAREGLAMRGVSSPSLRLKFWKLQTRILDSLCCELGIRVMMPPERALDSKGFLRPEYYARDATHANWLYGERVLREIEDRFLSEDVASGGDL
jgi:hypothetical protein